MSTLMQQLAMSYEADGSDTGTTVEHVDVGSQIVQAQQQQQSAMPPSRDRETVQLQLHLQQQRNNQHQRGLSHHRMEEQQQQQQQRDREQLHQLQAINNLLSDLPSPAQSPQPPSPITNHPGLRQSYSHDVSHSHSTKGGILESQFDGDMSISDLFGLSLPRGPLMSGQSTTRSSGITRHNHQHHGHSRNHGFSHQQYQHEEGCEFTVGSTTLDLPSSPTSVTTPGSPSTPGSLYSNPYSYSSVGTGTGTRASSLQANRSSFQNLGCSSSSHNTPYYGRPIRGSPPYSDCESPTLEYPTYHVGPGKSRSNSPADSETSGVSSLDGSMSDIMNCLSLNSSSHGCYSQSLGTLMLPDVEIRPNNRAAALQRMAVKKLLANSTPCHGHHHPLSHGSHVHNRATAAAMTAAGHHYAQSDGLLNSLLSHEKNCCSPSNSHILMVNSPPVVNTSGQQILLDRAARFHRNAAALCDATCTWSGVLPPRAQFADGYSSKVFLGGVPWDINESILMATFKQFGQIRVEWPGKEQSAAQPKGFVYIIFETENQVRDLLDSCTHDFTNGGSWYYKISSKRMKGKEVQVIPWILNDSNYSKSPSQKLNPDKTVFVGALHGMLTAQGLAKIMNDLFDDVIYAGIDTDKYKYPIGSGRVTFSSKRSYRKAVAAAFIEIKTAKFTKKVQVDPYIEDSMCSGCHVQRGPYFCREEICFRYFCRSCWQWTHAMESMQHHNPMTRDSKTTPMVGLTPHVGVNFGSRMLSNYAH